MAIKTYSKNQFNLRLTTNFKVSEFTCKCGCSTAKIDDKLVNFVQKIRTHFRKPTTINSGYRCSKHNAKIGGASKSKHVYGQAADIVVEGVSPKEVAKYAESIGVLGIGLYNTDKDGHFVHIDTRPTKFFWLGHAQVQQTTFGGSQPKSNAKVKAFQQAAIKDGFKNILVKGANGIWDEDCTELAKKAVLYKTKYPWRLKNLTKVIQKELGLSEDGKFGAGTHSKVLEYQKKHKLTADGIVRLNTWKKILGI